MTRAPCGINNSTKRWKQHTQTRGLTRFLLQFKQVYLIHFCCFAGYLKNGSTDFKIEDRSFIVSIVTNSLGSAGLKIMIKEKKSGLFLRFRTDIAFLSYDLNQKSTIHGLTVAA